jgi:VWFA-related protein
MRRRGSIAATAGFLVLCGAAWLSAQQAGQTQTPSFRSGVELVTVDVGVVDRQGQPVRGLEPADFTVTVAGQPRRVVTAEFVDVAASRPNLNVRPDIASISTNEGGGIGRLFVFVVDQNTLEPGNARYVATAASRFFSQLTFADRSALMLLPVGPNIGFTWAHDRVREGLQHVTGLGGVNTLWEYGSLAEARDIANRNMMTVRTVGERECRGSIFASGSGAGAGGVSAAPPSAGPAPPSGGGGGGAPSGGGDTGGSGAPAPSGGGTGGGGGGSGGSRGSGASSGLGGDACTRDIQMQAEGAWRSAQMTSLASIAALRQLLGTLAQVHGDKTVILISGGWPLDERDETSAIAPLAADAAAARATLYTLFVPRSMFSADRRVMNWTPARDQYLHSGPLENLAGMTGGGSFRAEVSAEAAFDRLTRELSGYYRIGVEKDPADQDGKGRRMKVQVSRGATTVRAREIFDTRTYEDRDWAARMGSALDAPIPATSIGLRVTSYLAADPDDRTGLKLVLSGEASRLQPGDVTFQILVRDLDGKRVLTGERPLGEATTDGLPFSTNVSLAPGRYIVRVALMDSAGRVGSVDHRVDVQPTPLGSLSATGPILVRVSSRNETEPRIALDAVRQDERLALELDLEGDGGQASRSNVLFEIASTADGPALLHTTADLTPGSREGSTLAQGVTDMRVLPPGQYVVRAKVSSGNQALGEMRRSFTVLEAPRLMADGGTVSPTVVGRPAPPATLAARAAGNAPRFAIEQVLAPDVRNAFLDRVAARPDADSPEIRDLIQRARAPELRELNVSDALAAESPVAAFVSGLNLLAQNKLDPAANAFRTAMRASADFYPAMVYLGACYAAGGNDKEAAGAWRTALIKEGNAVTLYTLIADAFVRQGRGDLALQALDPARARWPEDDGVKRRFVTAAMLAGRYGDGLQAVDELIDKRADDEASLSLGLLVLYEAFMNSKPIQNVDQDRARMTRYAEAYKSRGGPSQALVDTWMAAVARKR